MIIYRIYKIYEEYVPSDYVDEDGYIDDYYDDWIYHDVTIKYVATIEQYDKYCKEREAEDDYEEYLVEKIIVETE